MKTEDTIMTEVYTKWRLYN